MRFLLSFFLFVGLCGTLHSLDTSSSSLASSEAQSADLSSYFNILNLPSLSPPVILSNLTFTSLNTSLHPLFSGSSCVLSDPKVLLLLLALLPVLVYVLYRAFDFFCLPLVYVRKAGRTQFPRTQALIEQGKGTLLLSRRVGDFPPPYPNGWYVLCHASELKRGGVLPMNVLGKQLVLWRGKDGKPHLFEAYCKHLGANIAFGGEVRGNCLKCPFHGWEYDGSGACIKVPYAESTETSNYVKLETYSIIEQNQIIYYWHDAEMRDPLYNPPYHSDIDSGELTYHGRTEHHVTAHIQELPENGADVSHLNVVHTSVTRFVHHTWVGQWVPVTEKPKEKQRTSKVFKNGKIDNTADIRHWSEITIKEYIRICGVPIPFLGVDVFVHQVGPGIVWLRFLTPFGQALVIGACTPYGPMLQRTYHMIFSERRLVRFIAKMMVRLLGLFYEQDVMIWQWKTYPTKPILLKQDDGIKRYRKWFSQFYSEHSTSFEDAVNAYTKGTNAAGNLEW